jgi:two-component system response regulator DctR
MSLQNSLVIIVEDDAAIVQLIRAGLKNLPVEIEEHLSFESFLKSKDRYASRSGCLIMDVYLPDGNGMEFLSKRAELKIPTFLPLIFITGQGDIPMAVESMSKGAWSFLPKPLDLNSLRNKVTQACDWSIQEEKRERALHEARNRWDSLTEQEKLVARYMLSSMPNKNIAVHLDVSIRTVEARRHAIFEKLHVDGLCEFAQLATSLGIFPDANELAPNSKVVVEAS